LRDAFSNKGDLLDLTRIMLWSIRAISPDEKQEVSDGLNQ
jgi:hypothetical protein